MSSEEACDVDPQPPHDDGTMVFGEDEDPPALELDPLQRVLELLVGTADFEPQRTSVFGWNLDSLLLIRQRFVDAGGGAAMDIERVKVVLSSCFPEASQRVLGKTLSQILTESDTDTTAGLTWTEVFKFLTGVLPNATDEELLEQLREKECPPPRSMQEWLWAIMEQPASQCYAEPDWLGRVSWVVSWVGQLTILASVVNMVVESLESMRDEYGNEGTSGTLAVEIICLIIFSVEFILRCAACPVKKENTRGPMMTQREFWVAAWTWVDLVSILTVLLGLTLHNESVSSFIVLRVLRLLRLGRAIRVLKLGRHSDAIQLMAASVYRARVAMVWMMLFIAIATVFFAAFIWHVEKEEAEFDHEQHRWVRFNTSSLPDAGKVIPFQNIPDSMYWVLVTVTTVGYGDMTPVTTSGKAVAWLTMASGALIVAYPVTMLTSVFAEVHEEEAQAAVRRRHKMLLRRALYTPASADDVQLSAHHSGLQQASVEEAAQRAEKKKMDLEQQLRVLLRDIPEQLAGLTAEWADVKASVVKSQARVQELLEQSARTQETTRQELILHFDSSKEELLQTYRDGFEPQAVKHAREVGRLRSEIRNLVVAVEPMGLPELDEKLAQLEGREDELTCLRDFERHLVKRQRAQQRKKHLQERRAAEGLLTAADFVSKDEVEISS
eukprot:Hpha_TRINITY_DN26176_c0_g1::TRINITY_DN26176_c0_g1_i1::g.155372::m.155372/K04886/KCNB2; potassium voltage-gated channel Shab-related subfamily B member 2